MNGKVILCTPEPKDGAASYAAELAAAAARAGVRMVLFCPSNFEFGDLLEGSGAQIAHAPYRDIAPAGLLTRIWRNLVSSSRSLALPAMRHNCAMLWRNASPVAGTVNAAAGDAAWGVGGFPRWRKRCAPCSARCIMDDVLRGERAARRVS